MEMLFSGQKNFCEGRIKLIEKYIYFYLGSDIYKRELICYCYND